MLRGKLVSKIPANIHLFKVSSRKTRKRHEICSKLTIKTPERRQLGRSSVFIVNFKHISHLFLVFRLLTFEQVNVSWVVSFMMHRFFPARFTCTLKASKSTGLINASTK